MGWGLIYRHPVISCFADNLVDVHIHVLALSLEFLLKCTVRTDTEEEVDCCFGKLLNECPGEIGF